MIRRVTEKSKMAEINISDMLLCRIRIPEKFRALRFLREFTEYVNEVEMLGDNYRTSDRCRRAIEFAVGDQGSHSQVYRLCILSFIFAWSGYLKSSRNLYFSKNLTSSFLNANLDLPIERLPKNFSACMNLNQWVGPNFIHSCLVRITENHLATVTTIKQKCDKTYLPVGGVQSLKNGKTIKELVLNSHSLKDTDDDLTEKIMNFICAAVCYASVGHPDITKAVNEFDRNTKKGKILSKHYTTADEYEIVGEQFVLPPKYSEDLITRRGHFGFRWAGKGKTYLKWTWISESKPFQRKKELNES